MNKKITVGIVGNLSPLTTAVMKQLSSENIEPIIISPEQVKEQLPMQTKDITLEITSLQEYFPKEVKTGRELRRERRAKQRKNKKN